MKKKNKKDSASVQTDIAIVGMSSYFPDAENLRDYWSNILSKRDSIITNEDFHGYWNREDYYDPDPMARDKTYSDKAGFINNIDFDLMEYRIPPKAMDAISVVQLFALYCAKYALEDAGLLDPKVTTEMKEKVGVIFGQAGMGNIGMTLGMRNEYPNWEKVFASSGLPKDLSEYLVERFKNLYVEWQPDSFPGFISNVVAGRVGSCFDLGGTNCTIDAACAGSLAAIKMAIAELTIGSCDAVLTGGINVENSIFSFLCFSKTPALSKLGRSRPYDAESDGMMLGDGLGLMVLKRLEDAEANGDKIYAVIKGIGSSGDGRAKSIFAPRFEGQIKALARAYDNAGLTPADIQLVEGHGTGTVAGDLTEFTSLKHSFGNANCKNQSIALGSVKSQIGHTRLAAGAASMIKTALALHHKVLPPTINVDKPNPKFEIEKTPFYLNTETRPWIRSVNQSKRRAALSAFGFGGTNFHIIMEEYSNDHDKAYRANHVPDVLIFKADSQQALIEECKKTLSTFKAEVEANPEHRGDTKAYRDFVLSCRNIKIPAKSARLGFCALSVEDAISNLETAVKQLESKKDASWNHPRGIYFQSSAENMNGKVVALFPGQGSQYVGMSSVNVQNYPEMRQVLAGIGDVMMENGTDPVADVLYPRPVFDKEQEKEQQTTLTKTKFAQTAIGGISAGYFKLLKKAGFKPDFSAGHSFGELTALWASEVISDEDFYRLAAARGEAMDISDEEGKDSGSMLAVMAKLEVVENIIKDFPEIKIANYNSHEQIVLGGPTEAIKACNEKLTSEGKRSIIIPVAAAFHTDFVKHAQKPFAKALDKAAFKAPATPVFANVTGALYGDKTEDIKAALKDQIISPVRFTQIIEDAYDKGGRLFIEIGPKAVLSKLVGSILKGKEHKIISVNASPQKDGEMQFRQAFVQLLVAGVQLNHIDPYEVKPTLVLKDPKKFTIEVNAGFHRNPDTEEKKERALHERDTSVFDRVIEEAAGKRALELAESLAHEKAEALAIQKAEVIAQKRAEELAEERAFVMAKELAEKIVKEHIEKQKNSANTAAVQSSQSAGQTTSVSASALPSVVISSAAGSANVQSHNSTSTTVSAPAVTFSGDHDYIKSQIETQNAVNTLHNQFQKNHNKYGQLLSAAIGYQNKVLEDYKNDPRLKDILKNLEETLNLLDENQETYHQNHEMFFENRMSMQNYNFVEQTGNETQVTSAPAVPVIPTAKAGGEKPTVNNLLNSTILDEPDTASVGAPSYSAPVQASAPAAQVIPVQEKPAVNNLLNNSLDVSAAPVQISTGPITTSPAVSTTQAPAITSAPAAPAAPAVPEAVSSPAASADPSDVIKNLLDIVSEKTGYPKDMIDLDMDLEADMGIDSIKRVEILGTLFKGYDGAEMEDNIDFDSIDIDEFRTLRNIINFVSENNGSLQGGEAQSASQDLTSNAPAASNMGVLISSAPSLQSVEPVKAEGAENKSAEQGVNSEDFIENLLDIVSEKTGYPKDMIDLDMDLEADMGIDSIKRVEILGTLFKGYDDTNMEDAIDFDSIDIDEFRTLRNIVNFVSKNSGDLAGSAKTEQTEQYVEIPEDTIQRFAVAKKMLGAPDYVEGSLPEGHIWLITNDGAGICMDLAKELENRNEKCVILSFPESVLKAKTALKEQFKNYTLDAAGADNIAELVKTIESAEGTVGGFIHIHPVSGKIENIEEGYSEADYDIVKTVFFAAKSLKKSLTKAGKEGKASFITISRIDGQLGLEKKEGFAYISGGLTGLTKSLHREWHDVYCRHIDLDPAFSKKNAVTAIVAELSDSQTEAVEVGVTKQGERCTLMMDSADEATGKTGTAPGTDDVLFISGGGRGITAMCAVDMAKAYKCGFILAGRTPLVDEEPAWAEGVKDDANLKTAAIKELQRLGEQMTPVIVEKMLKAVQSQREIKQTIENIENAGGRAVYVSADIKNAAQLTEKLAEAEKTVGKVTGIVHGAGNLADKKIEKKSDDDFEIVFGTKIKGLKAILEAVNIENIQYFVLFSSVSGFFGNAGQTDYSLANDVLNKFAYSLKALKKDKDIKSINWGPWDSGMVSPTLKQFYKEKNIAIIPIPEGTDYMVKELSSNLDQEVQLLVCGGVFNPTALLKHDAREITIKRTLLPDNNNFLKDHVVGENRVLPATCAAGWMVKVCEDILPGYKLVKMEDFKVLKGVVFDGNAPVNFFANLKPVDNSQDDYKVLEVVIESESGRKLPNFHYKGTLHFSTRTKVQPVFDGMDLSKDNKVKDKLYIDSKGEGILFHGKSFKGVQEILNMSESAITARCSLAAVSDKNQGQYKVNSFNPYTADVVLHGTLIFLHQTVKEGALPLAFGEIEQYESVDFGEEFFVSTEIVSNSGNKVVCDMVVHNKEGRIAQRWKAIEATITPNLKDLFWNKKK